MKAARRSMNKSGGGGVVGAERLENLGFRWSRDEGRSALSMAVLKTAMEDIAHCPEVFSIGTDLMEVGGRRCLGRGSISDT